MEAHVSVGRYDGITLAGAIDTFAPAQRLHDLPLRMCINNILSTGSKVCVAGKVEAGSIAPGTSVLLMPHSCRCTCKSVCLDDGSPTDVGAAGDNVEVSP